MSRHKILYFDLAGNLESVDNFKFIADKSNADLLVVSNGIGDATLLDDSENRRLAFLENKFLEMWKQRPSEIKPGSFESMISRLALRPDEAGLKKDYFELSTKRAERLSENIYFR